MFGGTKRLIPVVGLGAWYGKDDDRESAIAALRRGLDLGLTYVDTAETYLSGEAEEWVGEAIESRRDQVFLVSKVLPRNASRAGTVAACEASLGRLKTDRLDGYLLHWSSDAFPLAETVEAFQKLEREGKILAWGVCNLDAPALREWRRLARGEGPVCDEVLYHLDERTAEYQVIPWCGEHGAALVAYSPFGHRDLPAPRTPGGRLLKIIAGEMDCTPRQVALSFLLRWPFSFAVPKASTPDEVEEYAGAGDVELSEMQIARIDKAFPPGPPPRELPMF